METGPEINAIRIGDTEYLLTVTADDAVHLTRAARPALRQTPCTSVPGCGEAG